MGPAIYIWRPSIARMWTPDVDGSDWKWVHPILRWTNQTKKKNTRMIPIQHDQTHQEGEAQQLHGLDVSQVSILASVTACGKSQII